MQIIQSIQNRIYEIDNERIMLDKDLAALYEVETKHLNEAVKRNIKRFPADFMFRLTWDQYQSLKYQLEAVDNCETLRPKIINIESKEDPLRSQSATLKGENKRGRHSKYTPYAFTEQGIAMLSGILNSDKAINTNIAIMRAFVEVRKILLREHDLKEQVKQIKAQLGEHDTQLNQIYDAMENLLDEKAAQKKWDERERIGYRK